MKYIIRKAGYILVSGLFTLFTFCSTSKEVAQKPAASVTAAAVPAIAPAAKLYAGKCVSCHMLYKPERYTVKEWNEIMPDMAFKSKLTQAETLAITEYLHKNAKNHQ